jgi:hypothetical protein
MDWFKCQWTIVRLLVHAAGGMARLLAGTRKAGDSFAETATPHRFAAEHATS